LVSIWTLQIGFRFTRKMLEIQSGGTSAVSPSSDF